MYHSFATRFVKVKCRLYLSLSDRCYRYVTFHNTENKQKSDDVTKYQNGLRKETQNHIENSFGSKTKFLSQKGY